MPSSDGYFKPGNPGRPKGARHKLTEDFLKALSDDFQTYGAEAIQATRLSHPEQYVKVVASLMPKNIELEVKGESLADMLMGMANAAAAQAGGHAVSVEGESGPVRH